MNQRPERHVSRRYACCPAQYRARFEFDKCVKRYNGNRHAFEFKCRDQFMVMSFAQFTGHGIACAALMQRAGCIPVLQVITRPESNISNARLCTYQRTRDVAHLSRLRSDIDCTSEIPVHHEPSRLDVTESSGAFDSSTMK